MPDAEKVIKGLGCCISGNTAICKRVGCPYAEEHDGIGDTCIDHLMADALALLKAQELADAIPVEWLKKVRKDASEGDSLDVGIAEVLDMWEKEQEGV